MDDEELLAALEQAVTADSPPPERLRASIVRASAWDRDLENLAELTHDSLETVDAGLRGSTPRSITFRFNDRELNLSIEHEQDQAQLFGIVDPPATGSVDLLAPGAASQSTSIDEDGSFELETDRTLIGLRLTFGVEAFATGLFSL